MHYWTAVRNEFVNRYAREYPFSFTDVKYYRDEEKTNTPAVIKKSYTFCSHKKLYLTQREADCIYFLAKGHTIKNTAIELLLSPRTVEFYLQRIKEKFQKKNKKELLNHLAQYAYFQKFMHEMAQEFEDEI
ncbi:LuxR C-terminal-related transcriptional regulator [Candidatus Comchoanobacter bicostacola]|uniref:LuxR C-terminal-related transcriptional regulator n=1 Tax=Candidatus Comchoanobacter bicostacola TaxID=2919598 RepID=A0ABY5DK59_9GAMM|nr:LuxR C-terminal-related transcriptional regulator [Candidatus Comchoanobacter bicostacola]UTC24651.1 LuxR C-terminal-related transcriptional regulator [Candidatus Comchoanobacter bicostacola]